MQVSLTNSLHEAEKYLLILLKLNLEHTSFNNLCDNRSMHRALLLHAKYPACLKESTFVMELQAEQATFFHGTPFVFERMTGRKPWLFRLRYLVGISEMSEVSMLFQKTTYLLPIIKFKILGKN